MRHRYMGHCWRIFRCAMPFFHCPNRCISPPSFGSGIWSIQGCKSPNRAHIRCKPACRRYRHMPCPCRKPLASTCHCGIDVSSSHRRYNRRAACNHTHRRHRDTTCPQTRSPNIHNSKSIDDPSVSSHLSSKHRIDCAPKTMSLRHAQKPKTINALSIFRIVK